MELMQRKQNESLNPSGIFPRYGWMMVPTLTNAISGVNCLSVVPGHCFSVPQYSTPAKLGWCHLNGVSKRPLCPAGPWECQSSCGTA